MSTLNVCMLLILVSTVSTRKLNDPRESIREKQSKLMKSFMKDSVNPCDDFYEYACGNWEKVNPIPKDYWKFSTFHLLNDNIESGLKDLLSQPIVRNKSPSAIDKAKLYYKNCIEEKARDSRGTEPLLKFIKDLGGWPVLDKNWSQKDFDLTQLAIRSTIAEGVIINYDLVQHPQVPTEHIIYLKQPTLGLPNRDNFLLKENSKTLEAYRKLIEAVLRLLKVDAKKARSVSKEIVNFEVKLANATLPPEVEQMGPYAILAIKGMQDAVPYIDWQKYFSGVQQTKIGAGQNIAVQNDVLIEYYLGNLDELLDNADSRTLANYIVWRCVLSVMDSLDRKFRSIYNDFNRDLTGQKEPLPLWKTCVRQINFNMGMATSSMFVGKYFDEDSKNETVRIINSLKEVFDENLLELDWIDAKTKAYASRKANAIKVDAGYPAEILSDDAVNYRYNDVHVIQGKHFENYVSVRQNTLREKHALLSKPFDKSQWPLPPTMVNAQYLPNVNRIIVLAGILQAPVFHKYFPQSLNYGGIGTFMGHEIVHGFDDHGRNFDIEGNTRDTWWSPKAISEFDKRTKCFVEQYDNFSKQDKYFKSAGTITENLADNGGIRLAYKAYLKWKKGNSHSKTAVTETLPNLPLNENQLFFLGFAQLFCEAVRPESAKQAKMFDSHSSAKYRVLGTLSNFEKFSEAYRCPARSPMNPSKKCRLW